MTRLGSSAHACLMRSVHEVPLIVDIRVVDCDSIENDYVKYSTKFLGFLSALLQCLNYYLDFHLGYIDNSVEGAQHFKCHTSVELFLLSPILKGKYVVYFACFFGT